MPSLSSGTNSTYVFRRTTRNLRWVSIAMVLATFPPHAPQVLYVYWLLGGLAIYNLALYIPRVNQLRLFRYSAGMIVVDCIFAVLLIGLVGNISTPYSALLVFVVFNAASLYRLKGVIAVAVAQSLVLLGLIGYPLVDPISLSNIRIWAITAFALFGLGYVVATNFTGDDQDRNNLELLRAKSELERLRLATLVNSLGVAVFVTDTKGKIVHFNEAARALTGSPDLTGVLFFQALPLRSRTKPQAKPIDLLHESSSAQHRRDLNAVRPDGNSVDLDISVTPVQEEGKKPTEYIFVCEDITTERSLEEQRSDFISVASHELRTPLAILEAALETVLDDDKNDFNPDAKMLLEQAHRNATLLANIIKDITMLAQARNDNLPVKLTQVEASEILYGLQQDFQPQASHKGMNLKVEIKGQIPGILTTEQYIREILQNYMTNALKYSQSGTITLGAERADNGGVIFRVTDEGMGIAPKDQKLLFTKFFRVEDYRTRTTGGTGLGLYLCQELANRLGGRLWCKSAVDKGSTFYLEVPPFSNLKRDRSEVVEAHVSSLVDGL